MITLPALIRKSVVTGTTADVESGVELSVSAEEQNVLRWLSFLPTLLTTSVVLIGSCHLQSFRARVVVPGFGGDPQIRLHCLRLLHLVVSSLGDV